MQRGKGGRDEFGSVDPFDSFGGFGPRGSLMSSVFGGRDPFQDPFFARPFGSMMGPSMFDPNMFHSGGSPSGEATNNGFLEQQHIQQNRSKGPIIQELSSDDDNDDGETEEKNATSEGLPKSSNRPYVQDPDEEAEDNIRNNVQYRNVSASPQARTYSFRSSTVTYGGLNGAYYTSSTTRKTSGDGVTVEESKEADTTTGKATHRISKGIHDKGHSVTRKLNSDGRVDTLQTLHNLNEDELASFEKVWTGKARQHLPAWNPGPDMSRMRGSGRDEQPLRGQLLPSAPQPQTSGKRKIVVPVEFI